MFAKRFDLSARGWGRVILFSCLGTLVCILVSFAIDSFSFETGTWRWGTAPWNNAIIPLVLAWLKESNESISVGWESITGRSYVLESASGLSNPEWSEVDTLVGDGSPITHSLSSEQEHGLIRVRVLP